MQPFEYPPVRYWSKENNGTLTGGRKKYFFKFAILTTPPWRARRWKPINSWSQGLSVVAYGRYWTWAIAYPACAVGDCPRPVATPGDLGETSGPRIDWIPPTRPPWWRRQYRDIKKLIFSAPRKCPIAVFGPVANRTVLERQRSKKKLVPLLPSPSELERCTFLCPRWTFGFGAALKDCPAQLAQRAAAA